MMFKRDLLELILKGEKTVTRRPTESKPGTQKYELGKVYGIRNGYVHYKAYVKIMRKYTQPLGKMTEEDARKEGFKDLEAFKKRWFQIYRKCNPQQVVWVFEFELANLDSASKGKLVPLEASESEHP